MSLLEQLSQSLDQDTIAKLSQQIGADPQKTSTALNAALPALLGGLAKNASTPSGAQQLDSALQRDHDGSLLDNLGAMFGGGGAQSGLGSALGGGGGRGGGIADLLGMAAGMLTKAPGNGGTKTLDAGGILGHILGGKRDAVENGVSKGSGLDKAQVAKLLMLAAPLVMGALGRMKQKKHLDAGGVSEMVQKDSERAGGGLLGGLLDKNDDGSIADDLAKMAGKKILGGLFS